ncbi:RNA (guanine-9-)-methyltransferase domain-containing protein 1-like protein, mitochondrial [Camponotus floridanus]|uniref:RNA (Guanine-9-)-methyltransferase domain-containing protein 1-like protein, mitochondrial n=1 Tax=Camponotus floridanus TaxID=104421 RepID=E2AZI2_CAMFO|nr:RNA (guanine-9-)-methyltransferase domain-containing protein 1-like protein, mitochondrial [Camponotus floridanus]
MIDSRVNIHWSKRSYCQATIQQIDRTNINIKEKIQQEFDEFLSNPENKKVFEILKLEIDVLRHNAEKVPEKIEPRDWLTLLKTTTKTQRKRYLKFLWLNEMTALSQKAKKELKKTEALAKKAEQIEDTGEMKYGLSYNTLFLRIYESTMNRYYNSRVFRAMMFEPKIVFDCGYEEYMSPREIHACAKQLTLSFAANRVHINPMSLYFCNMNEAGSLLQQCNSFMPNLLDDDCPLTVTSQSYLDLFPKNQLIYLTPHCKVNMTEYNPEMVYILGAIVDKVN